MRGREPVRRAVPRRPGAPDGSFACGRGSRRPSVGRHALELLLRLFALTHEETRPELAAVARHPGACLAALDDFAAAGWLEDGPGLLAETLPAALQDWLPLLRATGSWVPHVDRRLARTAAAPAPDAPALAVCVFGWDASAWSTFDLLVAAARAAGQAEIYAPYPRGTSEAIQQHWLEALETTLGTTFDACEAGDFVSAQSALASRLEGTDLAGGPGTARPAAPEFLAGHDTGDMAALACDFVARWLAARPVGKAGRDAADGGQRLVLLCPTRDVSSVGVVKALAAAGIAVEDEVGEQPEPALAIQIQRAVIAYHQRRGRHPGVARIDRTAQRVRGSFRRRKDRLAVAGLPPGPGRGPACACTGRSPTSSTTAPGCSARRRASGAPRSAGRCAS